MKIGRYDVPIDYLKNVVNKYPDHAFGHYFLAECYRATDKPEQAQRHLSMFADIYEHDDWWRSLAAKYGISPDLGMHQASAFQARLNQFSQDSPPQI